MEPLAAFSLAGTILAFTRFGISLLSDGHELYKSTQGILSTNEQLELATADLRALLVKLRTRHASADEVGETFQQILRDAEKAAKELVDRLDGLKIKGPKSRKWESVRKAIQSAWTKDEIDSLTKKLARFKEAVETHILFSIVETLDEDSLQKSSRFDRLDEQTQLIISSLLDNSLRSRKTSALAEEVRDQMETLIHLVRRIDNVNTDEHHRTRTMIANKQVTGGKARPDDLNEIMTKFEMLGVSNDQETRLRCEVLRDIINTLAYPAMTYRYEDIIEAFPKTFEWAFEDSTTEQVKWSNFSEWLKKGSGVYWISGKAGSGKSTLMKHIFDDNRTHDYLKLWAREETGDNLRHRPIPLCRATFFFWNSGTPEQKSQSGLLRALLFQVLSSCPDLVSVVFPEIWAKRYKDSIEGLSHGFDQALTLRRLTTAFRKFIQQSMVPLKVCFLVDGLDEFNGDHEELAALFKLASESPMVKICLSSRPWVIFEQIYGSRPSMRLQDLTYHDIEHYVTSKFNRNPAFRRLESGEPELAVLLRNEVIEKAEGVFLWVQIVVESLLFGIRNQDDITILRERLIAMPPKLEDLYLHLMGLIEPVYQRWASKAFQIARAVREFCSDESAGPIHRTEGSTPLTISTFFLAITENIQILIDSSSNICVIEKVSSTTTRTLAQESLPAKCKTIKTHLTARCAGLLEVPRFEQQGPDAPIQFLHRTARDFLYNDENWSLILRHTEDTAFNPHRVMLMASVLDLAIKTLGYSMRKSEVYSKVADAMLYAYHVDLQAIRNEGDIAILDNLDQIMTRWRSDGKAGRKSKTVHWANRLVGDSERLSEDMIFTGLATLYGLTDYVSEKLGQLDRKAAAQIASKLLHILLPYENWPGDVHPPLARPEMVSTLLRHGADPNYIPHYTGPWSNMLWHISDHGETSTRLNLTYLRIMKLLIMAGANPRVKIAYGNRQFDAEQVVKLCVAPRFKEGDDLLNEIARQKSLEESKESQRDARGPVRKKQRLDGETPPGSSPRNIRSQSSDFENNEDTSVRERQGNRHHLSPPPPHHTVASPATPASSSHSDTGRGSTSPTANSNTRAAELTQIFWSTVL